MRLVYISSPLRGDMEKNMEKAKDYCAYAASCGVIPLAPHTIFTQYLNDAVPEQREQGLRMGHELLERCDELWVMGDTISQGMKDEIGLATFLQLPILYGYLLDISFDQFDPAKHRYFPLSSYNGLLREGVEMDSANRSYFREDFAGGKDRTTWFSPNKIWTNCGDKVLNVDIKAANVSENITPREYADLLFDGIGAALVFNFKRLKREEFDGLKPKIDWSIVESFPFPAPFEEQRYIGDEGEIHVYSWDGRKETTLVGPYSVRKLYLEHFGES